MRKVQTQLSRGDEGTSLFDVAAEGFTESEVEKLGCGVVDLQFASSFLGKAVMIWRTAM